MVAYDDDEALSPVPMLSAPPTTAPISESRRQALREIELKVVKYQDDLEACRKKGDSSVSDEAIAKVRCCVVISTRDQMTAHTQTRFMQLNKASIAGVLALK